MYHCRVESGSVPNESRESCTLRIWRHSKRKTSRNLPSLKLVSSRAMDLSDVLENLRIKTVECLLFWANFYLKRSFLLVFIAGMLRMCSCYSDRVLDSALLEGMIKFVGLSNCNGVSTYYVVVSSQIASDLYFWIKIGSVKPTAVISDSSWGSALLISEGLTL